MKRLGFLGRIVEEFEEEARQNMEKFGGILRILFRDSRIF